MLWYVSYGSNLLEERFRCYIQGGVCRYNERQYGGCDNKKAPEKSVPVMIPYNMYYSNKSPSWGYKAVSFLDISKPGFAYGRAWLIEEDQIKKIHEQEGKGWYPERHHLADIEGIPAYTFSPKNEKETKRKMERKPKEAVSQSYIDVLFEGMKETYPDMTDDEIYDYLKSCGRN